MTHVTDHHMTHGLGFVQTPKDDNGAVRAVSKVKYINGLKIATGTEDGRVIIYDLRQTRPLVVKDHMYETPINEIHYNEGTGLFVIQTSAYFIHLCLL